MKPKSPATSKLGKTTKKMKVAATKGGKPNRGTIKKKTSSATDQTAKKAVKQRKGSGKSIVHTKATRTTSNRSSPQTPERKVRSPSAHSTPSTVASTMSSSSIKKTTSSATDTISKKSFKQRNGSSKSIQHTKATTNTSESSSPQTPERKVRSPSAHSTPSTAASSKSSSSKRAVSLMSSLALFSPPKKSKNTPAKQNTVDFNDASEFDWLRMNDVDDALVYHGEELSELSKLEYYEKIFLLCSYFKPNDIRPVFQGIYQDAGMNWRDLKLAKYKTMKTLSTEFAKACVDIYNARVDLTVPEKITIDKETRDQGSKA